MSDNKRRYEYAKDGYIIANVRAVCWDDAWLMIQRQLSPGTLGSRAIHFPPDPRYLRAKNFEIA
jgi:hypothetical protein